MCLCESKSGISLKSRSVYAQLFILTLPNVWLEICLLQPHMNNISRNPYLNI